MAPTSKPIPEYKLEAKPFARKPQHRPSFPQNPHHDSGLSIRTRLESLTLYLPTQPILVKPQPTPTHTNAIITQTSPLLNKLPPELRLHIYALLTPPSNHETIARSRALGVSSVSHTPPPLSFLLSCRQIAAEAQSFYYARAVWKVEGVLDTENSWALSQVEELLGGSVVWERLERVEVVCFWQRSWARANGVDTWGPASEEVRRKAGRVGRVVDVLRAAPGLRTVVVSWKEVRGREGEVDEGWAARREVLKPLERLKGIVDFRAGELVAGEEMMGELTKYLRELTL
jgi:hypothetical protein